MLENPTESNEKKDDSWRKIHETARQAKRRVPEAGKQGVQQVSMRRTDLKPKLILWGTMSLIKTNIKTRHVLYDL